MCGSSNYNKARTTTAPMAIESGGRRPSSKAYSKKFVRREISLRPQMSKRAYASE